MKFSSWVRGALHDTVGLGGRINTKLEGLCQVRYGNLVLVPTIWCGLVLLFRDGACSVKLGNLSRSCKIYRHSQIAVKSSTMADFIWSHREATSYTTYESLISERPRRQSSWNPWPRNPWPRLTFVKQTGPSSCNLSEKGSKVCLESYGWINAIHLAHWNPPTIVLTT